MGVETGRLAGPSDMRFARAMARFAADAELAPPALIGLDFGIVVLVKVGLVTDRAARLPVLVGACPVEPVAGRNILVWIELKPAPCAYVPGNIEGLQSPAVEFNEILLKRR